MKMNPPIPGPDILQLADTIRQYLINHPNSADTLEGVVNWWLVRQRYENAMSKVSQALELMVKQGELIKIQHQGSHPIYKVKGRA